MKTNIVPIIDSNAIERAEILLEQEQVIAAPTDTVFGVMCRYDSVAALTRLYEAKDRPPQKAIPILLGSISQLAHVIREPIDPRADELMEKFWPGPLTIILPARQTLPTMLTAGQATVAVRIPEHDQLRQLLNSYGPLAVTSANLSGQSETHSAAEVYAQLGGRIPLILDDDQRATRDATQGTPQGTPPVGVASTIIDLSSASTSVTKMGDYKFLRGGPIQAQVQHALDSMVQPHKNRAAGAKMTTAAETHPQRTPKCE